MSYLPGRLLGPVVLGTAAADLCAALTRAFRLEEVLVANTTGGAVTARLSLTPQGGSLVSGAFLPDITVAAHDVVIQDLVQVLNIGDKLNGLASVNPGVIIMVSGLFV